MLGTDVGQIIWSPQFSHSKPAKIFINGEGTSKDGLAVNLS
jgi:hypothetical protein